MPYYDYEDYYEPSEFDEKVEEFKNYLRESIKQETQDTIKKLNSENQNLRQINSKLQEENRQLEEQNSRLVTDNLISQIILPNINKNNIYKIIENLFPNTFSESSNHCPPFWTTYVNYYNNRKEVVLLLKYSGVDVPKELDSITLPHEWNESLLDKFFETMNRHVNCSGAIYRDNLQYWTYIMAADPFNYNRISSYDEIPWQFVLRNPLLNTEKYALKIANEMNRGFEGVKFAKICDYQELDMNILKIIIDNLVIDEDVRKMCIEKEKVVDFLIEHIEMVKDEKRLERLYDIVSKKWRCEDTILKMPKKYQMQYAQSLKDPNKMIEFLNQTKFTKEEKAKIMNNLL